MEEFVVALDWWLESDEIVSEVAIWLEFCEDVKGEGLVFADCYYWFYISELDYQTSELIGCDEICFSGDTAIVHELTIIAHQVETALHILGFLGLRAIFIPGLNLSGNLDWLGEHIADIDESSTEGVLNHWVIQYFESNIVEFKLLGGGGLKWKLSGFRELISLYFLELQDSCSWPDLNFSDNPTGRPVPFIADSLNILSIPTHHLKIAPIR